MKTIAFGFIVIMLVSGCASQSPEAIASPIPIIALPSTTPLSLTETTDLIAQYLPTGKPVSEWNGVPIMPSALKGDGDAESYRFKTAASREQIQAFYQTELPKLGWEMLGSQAGSYGAVLLIFTAEEETITISILPYEDTFIVMIVK